MREYGFINVLICAVMLSIQIIGVGLCMEYLFTGNDAKISRKKRIILWILAACILQGLKCMVPLSNKIKGSIAPILMTIFIFLFPIYCYAEKTVVKITHTAAFMIQNILANVIYEVVFGLIPLMEYNDFYYYKSTAEGITWITIFSIGLNILYTILLLKLWKKKRLHSGSIWVMGMLFILFIFIFIHMNRVVSYSEGNTYFIFICIFTLLEFGMIILYLNQLEKREIQDELRQLQYEMGLEKVHYEEIEKRREEMAKLRHDYNNVITSILLMIKDGRNDEAEIVLNDFQGRIGGTSEYHFCAIPIINAVLTEKQAICKQEKIDWTWDLILPEDTGIADLDLCMIAGNLMDNAIRACKEVNETGKKSQITLKGKRVQGYIIFKCENTMEVNSKKQIRGTGYGQKILRDIASRYDGDFHVSEENGIYTAQISLKNLNK